MKVEKSEYLEEIQSNFWFSSNLRTQLIPHVCNKFEFLSSMLLLVGVNVVRIVVAIAAAIE